MDSNSLTHDDDRNSSSTVDTLLKQLNVSRRMLNLYPTDHPQILTSISRTLTILNRLWDENRLLTLSFTPTTLYVNNQRIAQQNPIFSEFARFFFQVGVASISFHKGLDAQELIRFHRLLQNKDQSVCQEESFDALLKEEKIVNISVQLIDYAAFREKKDLYSGQNTADSLWEDFFQRVEAGDIESSPHLEPDHQRDIAVLFSRKLSGAPTEQEQAAEGSGRLLAFSGSSRTTPTSLREYNKKINMLLERLTPETRSDFLHKGLKKLENHELSHLQLALQRISPGFLEGMVAHATRVNNALSPRLLNLINALSTNVKQQTSPTTSFSSNETRTRLDILFREEQTDIYLPTGYQQALHVAANSKLPSTLLAEDRTALIDLISSQSVEKHAAHIIFERLHARPDQQLATTFQNHLLDFSRMFLEAGDYTTLHIMYQHWLRFINQSENPIELLAEKLVAYHTQASFMAEVLDGFDLWETDKHQELTDYIVLVGDPYSEPIVERLGLAHHYPERQRWIDLLTRISGNVQQKIIPWLSDDRWYLVRNLVMILGTEPSPAILKAIQPLHQHPHPQVRAETIRLLFSCNPATANRLLLRELNSNDQDACLAAVSIAHLSRDPATRSFLHRRLEKEPSNDIELTLLRAIVQTLCRRGEKESLVILRRVLNRGGLLVSRRSRQLQQDIVIALAGFHHPAADKLLEELASGRFRRDVATALAKRREPL